MISKYPDISSKTDKRFGYFLGYFSSTLTISWKEKYHLKYQEDYDKIVWIQSLNIALEHDEKLRDSVKLIYAALMKQPSNKKDGYILMIKNALDDVVFCRVIKKN